MHGVLFARQGTREPDHTHSLLDPSPSSPRDGLVTVLFFLFLFLSVLFSVGRAQASLVCAGGERAVGFSGVVQHGSGFEHAFGAGLVFRLVPHRDVSLPGWVIEVRRRGENDSERELSWVVTPPYRGWNPRYLDVSYGKPLAETLRLTPREFFFVADADWERAVSAVRRLLWPGNATTAELDLAHGELVAIAVSRGELHIQDARVGRGSDGRERIERLGFVVNLCVR